MCVCVCVCVCVFIILDLLSFSSSFISNAARMTQKGTDILNTPYDRIVARDYDDEEDRDA